jgi:hypothetical protein
MRQTRETDLPETPPQPASPLRELGEPSPRAPLIGFVLGWLIMLAVILPAELDRWRDVEGDAIAWLFDWNVDSTPFLLLLFVAPLCWRIRRPLLDLDSRGVQRIVRWLSEGPPDRESDPAEQRQQLWRTRCLAFLVGLAGFLSCLRVASTVVSEEQDLTFGELPPALHDEFSYLFQAETFLAGRWHFWSDPSVPRVFDQMHVLNEGRFASRYFPGTGLWMAPFVAIGNPWLGHWLATALICMLVFGIGRELSCNGVGLLAGLLAALSPGLVLFGNLLLAHQPGLLGLSVFIYAFLRMTRVLAEALQEESPSKEVSVRGKIGGLDWFEIKKTDWICLSGYALMFAMLCRPMTAAGVALPFGIWLLLWLIEHGKRSRRLTMAILTGYGVPLLLGFGIILVHNKLITGDAFRTPYQLYTETFTPRHMYGFDNVVRAEPFLIENGDRILRHYDRWAENLDAELAVKNVGIRFLASWQWTLGLSALIVSGCVFVFGRRRLGRRSSEQNPEAARLTTRWWLIPSSIMTLHLAHIPYWYDGILHLHYVFESGVLWCLVAAAASLILVRTFRSLGRPGMSVWWGAVLLASVLVNNLAVSPFWTVSRLGAGTSEFAFARQKQFVVRSLVEQSVTEKLAVILIRHDPADRHNDYVSNHPSLTGPILYGRLPMRHVTETPQLSGNEQLTVQNVIRAFPNRAVYVLDIAHRRFGRVDSE